MSARITPNMHNFTDEHLADEIGALDDLTKQAEERLKSLKDEAKRRGFEFAQGEKWRITVDRGEQKRLDTKALREKHPKIAAKYDRVIPTCTLRISSLFQEMVMVE